LKAFKYWSPPEDFEKLTILGQEGILYYLNEGRKLQRWGHTNFPGEEYSSLRHTISSFIFAKQYGPLSARLFGFGNEGIGIFIDLNNELQGQPGNAFQWEDLFNNEKGIWQSWTK